MNWKIADPRPLKVLGGPLVNMDAGDRFILGWSAGKTRRLTIVNTTTPAVYSRAVVEDTIGVPLKLQVHGQSPASGDPEGDRFCFLLGDHIIVVNTITQAVYAHMLWATSVDAPRQLRLNGPVGSGDPEGDRFIFPLGGSIIVVNTTIPSVYLHKYLGNGLSAARRLPVEGISPASGDPSGDRFVFSAFRGKTPFIVVVNTSAPAVYAHPVYADASIHPPLQVGVSGTSPASGDPANDRFLVPLGTSSDPDIVVVNMGSGDVFAHRMYWG